VCFNFHTFQRLISWLIMLSAVWIKFLMVVHELMIEISLEGKGICLLPL
jgi:hypothetical protein